MILSVGSKSLHLRSLMRVGQLLLLLCFIGLAAAKPRLHQPIYGEDSQLLDSHYAPKRPFYIDCISSSECFKGYCCAIGRQRFALPQCMEHGGQGDVCIPGAMALQRNLTYPDGATVRFTEVYESFCKCSFGLFCDPETFTCQSDAFAHERNSLDY